MAYRVGGDKYSRAQLPFQFLGWEMTLSLLGVPPERNLLPHRNRCPLCQQLLTVYPDLFRGVWLNCDGCGYNGELLELCMRVWGLDAQATLAKLHLNGVIVPEPVKHPKHFEFYERHYLPYRKSVQGLWQRNSQAQFQNNSEIVALHEQLALHSENRADRWFNELGKYVGTGHHMDWINTIHSGFENKKYFFKGHNWKDVVVIPAFDIPGRVCGVWFIGREGRPEDTVFIRVQQCPGKWGSNCIPAEMESGLAFMGAAEKIHPTYGNTVFVVTDPFLALRLHGQNFRDNSTPLPVVLTYEGNEGAPHKVWGYLPEKDYVFWSATPTREVFSQAREANGRVLIEPVDELDLARPNAWLAGLVRKAKPWRETLGKLTEQLEDNQIEDILLYLDLSHRDVWNEFAQHLPKASLPRVEALMNRKWPIRTVSYGKYRIQERKEGWLIEQTGELVSDAVVHFTKAVRVMGAPYAIGTQYRGYVEWKGKRAKVRGATTTFRHKFTTIVERALINAHLGPPQFAPGWSSKLLDLALKFSQPKLVVEKYDVKKHGRGSRTKREAQDARNEGKRRGRAARSKAEPSAGE